MLLQRYWHAIGDGLEARFIGWKSRRKRSKEDDDSLTLDLYGFGLRDPNSVEIGLAVLEILF